jgi:type II secretory pathway pseudopilin PulG
MRPRRAFTLAELLAVIGIMMILLATSIGVLVEVSKQMGPEASMAAVQSMCNAARDFAVNQRVKTRIKFERPTATPNRTVMSLEYLPLGKTTWTISDIKAVPTMTEVPLGQTLLVLNGIPTGLPTDPTASDYRAKMLGALRTFGSGQTAPFYFYFNELGSIETADIQSILTIVDVAADGQVVEYAFFPLNVNTGTRLVFE